MKHLRMKGWSLKEPGSVVGEELGGGGGRGTVGGALGHLEWSLKQEQGIKMIPVAGGAWR